MSQSSTLLMTQFVTHDVKRFLLRKPDDMRWEPGQGVALRIDEEKWQGTERPFTPTSLREDRVLELTIKRYSEREGVTSALHALEPGAKLCLGQPFGTITYRGHGTFIAAGTGVTPFLAIFRDLASRNALSGEDRLLLSNKSEADVICGEELKYYLGDRCVLTFTREHQLGQEGRRIDAAFLNAHIGERDQSFYICGPDGFVRSVSEHLLSLGVHGDRLVVER